MTIVYFLLFIFLIILIGFYFYSKRILNNICNLRTEFINFNINHDLYLYKYDSIKYLDKLLLDATIQISDEKLKLLLESKKDNISVFVLEVLYRYYDDFTKIDFESIYLRYIEEFNKKISLFITYDFAKFFWRNQIELSNKYISDIKSIIENKYILSKREIFIIYTIIYFEQTLREIITVYNNYEGEKWEKKC